MSQSILCVGEVLWDIFPSGRFLGGAPFNVACHLQKLGQPVTFASRVGQDNPGREALQQMKRHGMCTDLIQIDEHCKTGLVTVLLGDEGQPTYDILQPAAWDYVTATDQLLTAATGKILVYGSLAQRHSCSRATIGKLREVSAMNVFDINLRPPFDDRQVVEVALVGTDLLKLNEAELRCLARWFGLQGNLKAAGETLCRKFDIKTLCVTRGADGAALFRNRNWVEHPGYKVAVQDTVGAGDAFLAALVSGLLQEKNIQKMLSFANAVGAFVASRAGATPQLNMTEIDQLWT